MFKIRHKEDKRFFVKHHIINNRRIIGYHYIRCRKQFFSRYPAAVLRIFLLQTRMQAHYEKVLILQLVKNLGYSRFKSLAERIGCISRKAWSVNAYLLSDSFRVFFIESYFQFFIMIIIKVQIRSGHTERLYHTLLEAQRMFKIRSDLLRADR